MKDKVFIQGAGNYSLGHDDASLVAKGLFITLLALSKEAEIDKPLSQPAVFDMLCRVLYWVMDGEDYSFRAGFKELIDKEYICIQSRYPADDEDEDEE